MGLSIVEIIFENGFPELGKIKENFSEKTGLKLHLYIDINLVKITHDKRKIISLLENDILEIEQIDKDFNGSFEKENAKEYKRARNNLNHLNGYSFYASGFQPLHFFLVSDKISIYDNGSYYFLDSIVNVLIDFGGKIIKSGPSGKLPEKLNRRVFRKNEKLKKWNEYKWYNRPKK